VQAGERVRERILDSAEALFAGNGFFGTSIRDVTAHAGLRLAAVNYHFGTKEKLFGDVLLRRATVLNAQRLRLLGAVRSDASQDARVRGIVAAFVKPVESRAGESDGWRSYLTLIAQVANARLPALTLVADHFNAVASEFVRALGAVFPRAKPVKLHHAYQFMLASTLYAFSNNLRLDVQTEGKLRSDDFGHIAATLVDFVAGGVMALCAPRRRLASSPAPA
jgi:AcrR family transcriptional regulator